MTKALVELGIDITIEEARAPMGAAKWIDIYALLLMPKIAKRWLGNCGNTLNSADVYAVFKVFVTVNKINAAGYADLIPGTFEAIWAQTSHSSQGA
jgi:phosphonoacetaldehyde hydrolase